MKKLSEYKYEDDGQSGYTLDECHFDDAESLIQVGFLKMCGCGCPSDNLKYIRDNMQKIVDDKFISNPTPEQAFFGYWLDQQEFTEHGTSISGAWLTEKGKQLLSLLNELDLNS